MDPVLWDSGISVARNLANWAFVLALAAMAVLLAARSWDVPEDIA
jgi:hypothetical protein